MEYILLKEKAIKYIGISKKTEGEVRKKLKNFSADEELINKVIEYLKELGYIDDIDYVKSYIRQNINMLKYSKYELKQKLLQKGIKASIIEEKFETDLPEDYERIVIEKLTHGKLKNYEDIKRKEYLYRKGFRFDNLGEMYEE